MPVFILTFLFTLSIVQPNNSAGEEIEGGIGFYQGTLEEALELAKKEDKLVFVDVYATWCGPCKAMKIKSFTNEKVGGFYNQHFINVAIDGEKGEGLRVIRKYGVQAYPTLLFLDGSGKLVSLSAGYHSSRQLLKLGEQVSGVD